MHHEDKPTIRENLAAKRHNPPQAKLNPAIVGSIKGWFQDGQTAKDVHKEIRKRGYRVSYSTIVEIKGGRLWPMVKPSRTGD